LLVLSYAPDLGGSLRLQIEGGSMSAEHDCIRVNIVGFAIDDTDRRIVSVEFGRGEVSVRDIDAPSLHANHALHLSSGRAEQIVTSSSRDRQARGEALLAAGLDDPLSILRDTGGPGLPIRRDAADDPDEENTLATALFRVTQDGIEWSIYDQGSDPATYAGATA
jgi:hypothetical protein